MRQVRLPLSSNAAGTIVFIMPSTLDLYSAISGLPLVELFFQAVRSLSVDTSYVTTVIAMSMNYLVLELSRCVIGRSGYSTRVVTSLSDVHVVGNSSIRVVPLHLHFSESCVAPIEKRHNHRFSLQGRKLHDNLVNLLACCPKAKLCLYHIR